MKRNLYYRIFNVCILLILFLTTGIAAKYVFSESCSSVLATFPSSPSSVSYADVTSFSSTIYRTEVGSVQHHPDGSISMQTNDHSPSYLSVDCVEQTGYSNGFTFGLRFVIHPERSTPSDLRSTLAMSQTAPSNGFSILLDQDDTSDDDGYQLELNIGSAHHSIDLPSNYGEYILLISNSDYPSMETVNGYVLVEQSTGLLRTGRNLFELTSLEAGMNSYLMFGADAAGIHDSAVHQCSETTGFFSFCLDNQAQSSEEFQSLLQRFGVSNASTIDLSSITGPVLSVPQTSISTPEPQPPNSLKDPSYTTVPDTVLFQFIPF